MCVFVAHATSVLLNLSWSYRNNSLNWSINFYMPFNENE